MEEIDITSLNFFLFSMALTPSSIDGKWHHYCLVRSSDRITAFYDGQETFSVGGLSEATLGRYDLISMGYRAIWSTIRD